MASLEELAEQAFSLHQNGQLEDACNLYDQILIDAPDYAEILFYRGSLSVQLGEFDNAIQYFNKAAVGAPEVADIPFNLGVALKELGRFEEAVDAYQRAIKINNSFADAHNNLGFVLQSLNRFDEAVTAFQNAIEIDPTHVAIRINLALLLKQCGDLSGAAEQFKYALELDPTNVSLEEDLKSTYREMVPSWHFPMLNDQTRNNVYHEAIKQAVTSDDIVLDIGTGSGLLAMMAAKAGAEHVYACEIVKPIAEIAQNIIQENGFNDKITIFDKGSTELQVGRELQKPATLLISEILDIGLLGEGVLPSLKHATSNLITEEAIVIPASAKIWGVLVNCENFKEMNTVDIVHGFNLKAFNYFSHSSHGFDLERDAHKALSNPFEVLSIDFKNIPASNQEFELDVPVVSSGTVQAVVTWFDLNLFNNIEFSTRKGERHNHWRQIIHFLNDESAVEKGDTFTFTAGHSDKKIYFK